MRCMFGREIGADGKTARKSGTRARVTKRVRRASASSHDASKSRRVHCAIMTTSTHQPLFFASSDEEEDEIMDLDPLPESEPALSSPAPEDGLPVDDATDETSEHSMDVPSRSSMDDASAVSTMAVQPDLRPLPEKAKARAVPPREGPPDGIEVIDIDDIPVASSSTVPSKNSPPIHSRPLLSPQLSGTNERPAKKRRISPSASKVPDVPASSTTSNNVLSTMGSSIFLGSFVCGNAFSAAKGKGYTAPGQQIIITRDEEEDEPANTTTKGKAASKNGKSKTGGKKQLTLATALKPTAKKKKKNTIVRITNPRGFGMYLLLMNRAVSPLMPLEQSLDAFHRRSRHGYLNSWTAA
jgi:hypothetical protein